MLVNCVAYKDGAKIGEPAIKDISEYLKDPLCFVWVALKDPEEHELELMREEFNLHELAIEDAQNGHQRPKIEEYGDSLFVVMQTIELSEDNDLLVGELDIFVGKNYLLSVRNKSRQSFAGVRARCEQEPELLKFGSAFALYVLMDTVVDRYFPVITDFERQLEQIEERIFEKKALPRSIIEEVYELQRKLIILQHPVNSLLEAVGKLHGGRVPQLCQGMQDYYRDVSDHVIRVAKSIASIREMSTTAIQVNLSLIALSESEVTKKLASYGALFALPTAIAGIYGMNFRFMPELTWVLGYPLTLGLMFFGDLFLWYRFRKANWL